MAVHPVGSKGELLAATVHPVRVHWWRVGVTRHPATSAFAAMHSRGQPVAGWTDMSDSTSSIHQWSSDGIRMVPSIQSFANAGLRPGDVSPVPRERCSTSTCVTRVEDGVVEARGPAVRRRLRIIDTEARDDARSMPTRAQRDVRGDDASDLHGGARAR